MLFRSQRYPGLNRHIEWSKGGAIALAALGMTEADLEVWCEDVHAQFASTGV